MANYVTKDQIVTALGNYATGTSTDLVIGALMNALKSALNPYSLKSSSNMEFYTVYNANKTADWNNAYTFPGSGYYWIFGQCGYSDRPGNQFSVVVRVETPAYNPNILVASFANKIIDAPGYLDVPAGTNIFKMYLPGPYYAGSFTVFKFSP